MHKLRGEAIDFDLNVYEGILYTHMYGLIIITSWCNFSDRFRSEESCHTLQELKLQGIKIRDGVVFSQYPRAQCFAINLSDFHNSPMCLRRTGNQ